MGDIFRVNCPGCGEEKGLITAHPGTVGIHFQGGETALSQLQRVHPGDRPEIKGESESDTVSGDDRLNG
jgi:hypothetical protein